ncbi:hypothetical protein [Ciceribacter naphthalenivorans]|nr:hypothetical protein [Ciceribacter naphthalenivorans]
MTTTVCFIVMAGFAAPLADPLAARAQDADLARFTLEKTENGFVRLDRKTGALTLCREKDGTLTCRMAADERAAYEEELDRLEKRVDALEHAMATGQPLLKPEPLPSDEEVERSIGIMERFMRSFFGLVEEFKQKDEGTSPDKT